MATQQQLAKAKEQALSHRVQLYVLEAGKRYVALSSTNDGIAYEITVQSRETSPAPAQGPPIGGNASISAQSC
jgi:hypothetical protein